MMILVAIIMMVVVELVDVVNEFMYNCVKN